jgi:hypothetical protein
MTLPANQKLEDLFDMPRSGETPEEASDSDDAEAGNDIQTNLPVLPETLVALDKIESALPAVRGLEASDSEMDDLAARASESFDDLMSLGMQVDSRYASEIFAVASTMLGHAITAKTAKMNKKLKMIDLQLKKARLDQTEEAKNTTPTAEGRVLNRNDLLRSLLRPEQENSATDK